MRAPRAGARSPRTASDVQTDVRLTDTDLPD